MNPNLSVSNLAKGLVDKLINNSKELNVLIKKGPLDCTIIDAGLETKGSQEAGKLIAEICMGGLGSIKLEKTSTFPHWPLETKVKSKEPVISCLGSQYAGWNLSYEKFYALASGPGRAIARREDLFNELKYKDNFEFVYLVMEVDKIPPKEIIEKISNDCKTNSKNIFLILTPTQSISGVIQVVSRVSEVGLHKLHTLNFPLKNVVEVSGTAPIPPISSDFITSMGRTNDAILYGGNVELKVKGTEEQIINLAKNLPSTSSKDYGKPFAEIFKNYKGDFYAIDPNLFSPGKVTVISLETGKIFTEGELNNNLLDKSFGYEKK
ncbi:MAG: Methenyltetrahydromethanopterin cyclohydrolase [Alphaproteobacteria bacterium MarineAlpha6_Bin4]|nr:MAG: Methenyltetrahydromethanopterin cyclohydrolase [Alphaproteobacteria bacterium MarineAlpha6_Bin4]